MLWARLALASIATLLAGPASTLAQQAPADLSPPLLQSPVLTVKQDALFEGSAFGKAVIARLQDATKALQAENRAIELQLETEESALTARRPALAADEFRTLATAFDTKVEAIRAAQDAKSRDLTRQSESERRLFYDRAVPILADLMRTYGAVALLDQSAVVLSFEGIDVTGAAIARIDAALGPQDAVPAPPANP